MIILKGSDTKIGGSIIIESIFSVPGMGRLAFEAVLSRDYPLIMGEVTIASLLTLRKLPPGDPSRQQLIGFGDPLFSKEEAADAAKDDASRDDRPVQVASNVTRGMPLKRRNAPNVEGVDSLQLAQLPRLPDTAAELKSIALALQSDPAKVLNLGKEANEKNVKTMNLPSAPNSKCGAGRITVY